MTCSVFSVLIGTKIQVFFLKERSYYRCSSIWEVEEMNSNANKAIECTVSQCAHHCDLENYCSLNKIKVGTHECNPTVDQCTDCLSFARK